MRGRMHIVHVVGARPNFIKAAPVLDALSNWDSVSQVLVHTGQHYDSTLSEVFFKELDISEPDVNLEVGSGSHAVQTALIMMRLEEVLLKRKPNLVLVYGDVNSTVAAALVCSKLLITVGHVEAGLRSFDRTMPEEINRILTDHICDFLFTPSGDGDANLIREGVAPEKIHRVGNVMIDTLVQLQELVAHKWTSNRICREYFGSHGQTNNNYALVTLHRPSNVDNPEMLVRIMITLEEISDDVPILFPVHPRTREYLKKIRFETHNPRLCLTGPVGYLDFLSFQKNAKLVITDSGGIQEETTYLGVPCLTLRANTERPVTVEVGTNLLVGQDMDRLKVEVYRIMSGQAKQGSIPPLWDGKAGERIARAILQA